MSGENDKKAAQVTNSDFLTEPELRQPHQAFARTMTDPSTAPKIMMKFFNSYNRLLKRVEALEAAAAKTSDLANV